MNDASLARIALFLSDPHGQPPERIFADLERIAAAASRGIAMGATVEPADLVGELLQRRCGGDMAQVAWSQLDAAAVTGLLRRRFRQLAVELSDGWNGYRALRAQVARAVEELSAANATTEATAPPSGAPDSLYVDDRLCRQRVAQAIVWARQQAGDPALGATALAQTLARSYLPRIVPMAEANDDREEETMALDDPAESLTLEEQLDAVRLHREWLTNDAAGLRLIVERYRGATLESLAHAHGVALATMHGRLRAAGTRLAERARAGGYGVGAVRACLDGCSVDRWARAG